MSALSMIGCAPRGGPAVASSSRWKARLCAVTCVFHLLALGCESNVSHRPDSAADIAVPPPPPALSPKSAPTSGAAAAGAPASGATLPFRIELTEVAGSRLPAVQSYSLAGSGGKWLVMGGRIAGLHGFASDTNNFPRSSANTKAFVIDPSNNSLLGEAELGGLPAALAGPLTAANPQFVQVGADLFVVGGYGKDLASGEMTTFGSIIKVDVDGLISAILTKQAAPAAYFTQIPSPDRRLAVTGGALKHDGGVFYLVFGQNFTGDYSVHESDYNRAGGQFQQYTEKVRVFTLSSDLSIEAFNEVDGGYNAELPYHRRDLNVVDLIDADGKTPSAMVYGGVFQAGRVAGHTAPISLTYSGAGSVEGATVKVHADFKQALSQYDCAHLTVFDKAASASFTTLFGGISQYHYDVLGQQLVLDTLDLSNGIDGLPFTQSLSTIRRAADGTFSQYLHEQPLPGWLGAEAQFLPSNTLTAGTQIFANGVIALAGLSGRTLVGHLYGGIESFGPYSALVKSSPSTIATGRLFEVHVTPEATNVTPMPPLPTQSTAYPPAARDVCSASAFGGNTVAQAGCPAVCNAVARVFTGSWTNKSENVGAAGCTPGSQSVCGCQ